VTSEIDLVKSWEAFQDDQQRNSAQSGKIEMKVLKNILHPAEKTEKKTLAIPHMYPFAGGLNVNEKCSIS
jgi:hypothetical protein